MDEGAPQALPFFICPGSKHSHNGCFFCPSAIPLTRAGSGRSGRDAREVYPLGEIAGLPPQA